MTTPNGRRTVTPEEGRGLLVRAMLDTMRETADVACEQTWQAHARLLLKHGEKFLEDLGMAKLLELQKLCAEMVIKIRLANKRGAGDDNEEALEEFERMMQEVFAPEDVGGEGEDAT